MPRLLVQVSFPTVMRVSPVAVRTMSVGEVELKSKDTALMPRSLSGNSNHFPETLADTGDDAAPLGNLTFSDASRASSWRRAAGFSDRRPRFIAGSSLSRSE